MKVLLNDNHYTADAKQYSGTIENIADLKHWLKGTDYTTGTRDLDLRLELRNTVNGNVRYIPPEQYLIKLYSGIVLVMDETRFASAFTPIEENYLFAEAKRLIADGTKLRAEDWDFMVQLLREMNDEGGIGFAGLPTGRFALIESDDDENTQDWIYASTGMDVPSCTTIGIEDIAAEWEYISNRFKVKGD